MSELGIIKINQHSLVFNNELFHEAFNECDECLNELIQRRIKPIIVIHAPTQGAYYRTVASPTALTSQTKMIAHWVARLTTAGLTCAQLMIERPYGNHKYGIAQTLKTIQALAALSVIPIVTHNELTWMSGRASAPQQDTADSLAELLNAPVIEPLLTSICEDPKPHLATITAAACPQ
ncbi:hypothetical protein [Pseudomonas sp. CF161]|uniref:hypothetical protein n=1 Tax=Pseudomonas sp. CF161 TaxID=911241 RepID=UPI0003550B92|nr:hypothetical protein [Pseudomonas sp. CF161]EPL15564.1 hypothetical protein CF161_02981 [Pseudomonas sp. CF161]